MSDKRKNVLVEKYLEQHSLVESNIRSFNDFISNRMQQIINEVNETLTNEEVEIKLGRIRIGKPDIVEADGSTSPMTPMIARLRNLTYSSPVFVEITVKFEGQTESNEVDKIGRAHV